MTFKRIKGEEAFNLRRRYKEARKIELKKEIKRKNVEYIKKRRIRNKNQ